MATEKRLIWAHKAEELIKNFGKGAIADGLKSLDPVDDIILLAKGVGFIPTVDAVEVVHGRWNSRSKHKFNSKGKLIKYCDLYHCSECGADRPIVQPYNYCPNCGAKMDLEV